MNVNLSEKEREKEESYPRFFWRLLGILLIKALIAIACILVLPIHLAPDEAQYWTWSQCLDWGYYSKPPGIAWEIWLGTKLFGQTELGVRFGAVVFSTLMGLAVYMLGRALKLSAKVAFWAAVLLILSPFGWYLTFAATTDAGAILFLILAFSVIGKALTDDGSPSYIWAGCLVGCGALFKWTVFSFWPLTALALLFFPILRSRKFFLGLGISLLGLFPSLIWNLSHDWATFRHVIATVTKATGVAVVKESSGNIGDFFLSQVGLLSPVFFCLLILALITLLRRREKGACFCALFPAMITLFICFSFWNKAQANWALFLYPPCFVLIAWWGEKSASRLQWVKGGLLFSLAATAFLFSIPLLQENLQGNKLLAPPYRLNPFRQNMGWDRLQEGLASYGYNPEKDFLFSDKYQIASILSFYGETQRRAYFFNLSKMRKNQFSYWPSMQEETVGKTGYFVIAESGDKGNREEAISWYQGHYEAILNPHFKEVKYLGEIPLFSCRGETVKYALVYRCESYQGTTVEEFPSEW